MRSRGWFRTLREPERMWCPTVQALSAELGVSWSTVNYWVKQGHVGKTGKGYNARRAHQYAMAVMEEEIAQEEEKLLRGNGKETSDALERYRRAQAARAEYELELLKGSCVRLETVQRVLRRFADVVGSELRLGESRVLDRCGLEGEDLRGFEAVLHGVFDDMRESVNRELGELDVPDLRAEEGEAD